MNKTLRTTLIVLTIIFGATALVWTGFAFGRSMAWGYSGGMMSYFDRDDQDFNYGMMGGSRYSGMMGNSGYSNMMNGTGPSMMAGSGGYGMMSGSRFGGMMGNFGYENSSDIAPLSVEEAQQAVESYLTSFGNNDLAIDEIMVFDNNAYAIIVEKSTGTGAFELLVDPVTKAVYPEHGPNMMWNLKYGMMSGFGGYGMMGPGMMMGGSGYGGMMGGYTSNNEVPEINAELSVTPEQALESAQSFLDQYYPGVEVSDEVMAFYGYYTIDTQKDGAIVGMLSVNGFTRQVFPHTWHGDFIEMSEVH
jgi:hypothetical protein